MQLCFTKKIILLLLLFHNNVIVSMEQDIFFNSIDNTHNSEYCYIHNLSNDFNIDNNNLSFVDEILKKTKKLKKKLPRKKKKCKQLNIVKFFITVTFLNLLKIVLDNTFHLNVNNNININTNKEMLRFLDNSADYGASIIDDYLYIIITPDAIPLLGSVFSETIYNTQKQENYGCRNGNNCTMVNTQGFSNNVDGLLTDEEVTSLIEFENYITPIFLNISNYYAEEQGKNFSCLFQEQALKNNDFEENHYETIRKIYNCSNFYFNINGHVNTSETNSSGEYNLQYIPDEIESIKFPNTVTYHDIFGNTKTSCEGNERFVVVYTQLFGAQDEFLYQRLCEVVIKAISEIINDESHKYQLQITNNDSYLDIIKYFFVATNTKRNDVTCFPNPNTNEEIFGCIPTHNGFVIINSTNEITYFSEVPNTVTSSGYIRKNSKYLVKHYGIDLSATTFTNKLMVNTLTYKFHDYMELPFGTVHYNIDNNGVFIDIYNLQLKNNTRIEFGLASDWRNQKKVLQPFFICYGIDNSNNCTIKTDLFYPDNTNKQLNCMIAKDGNDFTRVQCYDSSNTQYPTVLFEEILDSDWLSKAKSSLNINNNYYLLYLPWYALLIQPVQIITPKEFDSSLTNFEWPIDEIQFLKILIIALTAFKGLELLTRIILEIILHPTLRLIDYDYNDNNLIKQDHVTLKTHHDIVGNHTNFHGHNAHRTTTHKDFENQKKKKNTKINEKNKNIKINEKNKKERNFLLNPASYADAYKIFSDKVIVQSINTFLGLISFILEGYIAIENNNSRWKNYTNISNIFYGILTLDVLILFLNLFFLIVTGNLFDKIKNHPVSNENQQKNYFFNNLINQPENKCLKILYHVSEKLTLSGLLNIKCCEKKRKNQITKTLADPTEVFFFVGAPFSLSFLIYTIVNINSFITCD